MERIVQSLVAEMQEMAVIDSHEHLPSEKDFLTRPADVFTRIFCHYTITNAHSAGMSTPRAELLDTTRPIEERWRLFEPYLEAIQDTGYARAAQITARELYGIDVINNDSYMELSERLQAANTPGLCRRIFVDRCRIERVLSQGKWDDGPGGYSVMVNREFNDTEWRSPDAVSRCYVRRRDANGGDFPDPTAWLTFWLSQLVERGVVGIKLHASTPPVCIEDNEAGRLYRKLLSADLTAEDSEALGIWLIHKAIECAPDYNLVVAIHCGIVSDCWNDFSDGTPMNLIPLFLKYRRTSFDLYHGGIPWVREIAVIGNQYPNVYLNLIWCHQISPNMTQNMLNEWIDLVPSNKIIGFGGDNVQGPEKTYGVLRMTQENIARALAARIRQGTMSETRAVDTCRAWLYDNPKRIYNL